MKEKIKIIDVNKGNIAEYPAACFLNPKNEGYLEKIKWLEKRFTEGLVIKQLYSEGEKRPIGFIEYVAGENAWRAFDAKGYLFIHCIWMNPNKNKRKGYGSLMIKECIKDAKKQGKYGVAVIAGDSSFIANKSIFLKNGFEIAAVAKPYELLVKVLKKGGKPPKFKDWEKQLKKYKGWNIIYSKQCPWVARSIHGFCKIAKDNGIKLKVIELKTAKQAQNAPSIYSVFNLVRDGKLLSDHYISDRRFQSIIEKELKK